MGFGALPRLRDAQTPRDIFGERNGVWFLFGKG